MKRPDVYLPHLSVENVFLLYFPRLLILGQVYLLQMNMNRSKRTAFLWLTTFRVMDNLIHP